MQKFVVWFISLWIEFFLLLSLFLFYVSALRHLPSADKVKFKIHTTAPRYSNEVKSENVSSEGGWPKQWHSCCWPTATLPDSEKKQKNVGAQFVKRIKCWAMGGITSTISLLCCINSHHKREVKFWLQLCCYLALLKITEPAVKYSSRIVETRSGLVRGVIVDPERKRLEPVEIFKSIPYARPPTGTLRFEPAQKIDPWQGTYLAERFGPVCPQVRLHLQLLFYFFCCVA